VSSYHLSPELVLVDPDLRKGAIAALPDRVWETYTGGHGDAWQGPLDSYAGHDRVARSPVVSAVLYAAVALVLLALSFVAS
jgi:hypothetical protein